MQLPQIGEVVSSNIHGLGKVIKITKGPAGQEETTYLHIKSIDHEVTHMVPANGLGFRKLPTEEQLNKLIEVLDTTKEPILIEQTKNKRYALMQKVLKKGNFNSLIQVLQSLFTLNEKNKLSHQEKKLLAEKSQLIKRELDIKFGDALNQSTCLTDLFSLAAN